MAMFPSHFPTFSLRTHNPKPPLSLTKFQTHHHFDTSHHRRCPISAAISASNENPRIKSKRVKSKEDLCNDIREFVSQFGFPEDHVPSFKEFQQHGRNDLAYIVRRRGYKAVRELIKNSIEATMNGSREGEELTKEQEKVCDEEEEATGQNEDEKDLAECILLSNEVPYMERLSSSKYFEGDSNPSNENSSLFEDSTSSLLQDKVITFIQNGELESVEGNGLNNVNESIAEDDRELSESHMETASENEEKTEPLLSRTDTAKVLNGSSISFQWVAPSASMNETSRKASSQNQLIGAETDKGVDIESQTKEDQVEIDRIKLMLHQKELELSHLKQQIEKEKQALAELQTKAESEISKAQKLVSEKDAELHAAEESLSGLKQVQIEYCGEGETVDVAGSFNGWHHRIKMDPQPASNIADPVGTRKSRLWRSVLWLYPGIYEIKFIVDGKWMIDPMKETITMGSIHNNILRVER